MNAAAACRDFASMHTSFKCYSIPYTRWTSVADALSFFRSIILDPEYRDPIILRHPGPHPLMALPTPSRTLPKSISHQTRPSLPTDTPTTLTDVFEAPAQPILEEPSGFIHPEHVIPPPNYAGIEKLVIVCCHAIFHPDASSPSLPLHSPYDESNWHLAQFQKSNSQTGKPGEHEMFMAHVLAGIDALDRASSTDDTLLVLSGGATKTSLTPLSEAQSYYNAALAHELAEGSQGGRTAHRLYTKHRILLEEHATDSFQNLLFAILLFRRTTGIYPKQIRIITHAFKARRFLDLHGPAIEWPSDRLQVQGINPVMSKMEFEETLEGEEKHGFAPWLQDPFGNGEVLSRKREQRGWDSMIAAQMAEGLEVSVKQLLDGRVTDRLPWTQTTPTKKLAEDLEMGVKQLLDHKMADTRPRSQPTPATSLAEERSQGNLLYEHFPGLRGLEKALGGVESKASEASKDLDDILAEVSTPAERLEVGSATEETRYRHHSEDEGE
jgi:hypothetical protein